MTIVRSFINCVGICPAVFDSVAPPRCTNDVSVSSRHGRRLARAATHTKRCSLSDLVGAQLTRRVVFRSNQEGAIERPARSDKAIRFRPMWSDAGVVGLSKGTSGMEYSMQQGTALPGVGHPVEHFRNTADAVRGRTHSAADVIDTAYSIGPAVKPLVLLAGEKGFIRLLKYIAENNGCNCILTEDFAEAIALAEIERPDLISLDDMLPPGSALAARQKIYQNPGTRHIPVLILAGSSAWPLVRQSSSAAGTNVLRFADIIMEHEAYRAYRVHSDHAAAARSVDVDIGPYPQGFVRAR
jgi:CheY-like chemotaxis protein